METLRAHDLRDAFNRAADAVRVLAVVSPTCAPCLAGHAVVKRLFERFDDDALRAFVVWIPMLPEDDAQAAAAQTAAFREARLALAGWDAHRAIGKRFEQTLGLTRTAWDVYLVYAPGVVWHGQLPPAPTYWMHQLDPDAGADPALWLDPATLAREVEALLVTPTFLQGGS